MNCRVAMAELSKFMLAAIRLTTVWEKVDIQHIMAPFLYGMNIIRIIPIFICNGSGPPRRIRWPNKKDTLHRTFMPHWSGTIKQKCIIIITQPRHLAG